MARIDLIVTGDTAKIKVTGTIAARATDVRIVLHYDIDAFEGLAPYLEVRAGDKWMPVLVTHDPMHPGIAEAICPWEVLVAGYRLKIGVVFLEEGAAMRHPTTWAVAGVVNMAPGEEELPEVSPQLAEQVIAKADLAEQMAGEAKRDAAQAAGDAAEAAESAGQAEIHAQNAANSAAQAAQRVSNAERIAGEAQRLANGAVNDALTAIDKAENLEEIAGNLEEKKLEYRAGEDPERGELLTGGQGNEVEGSGFTVEGRLQTADKRNLIAAINEALNSGGGSVTPEQIAAAIEAYFAEHPVPGGLTEEQVLAIVERYMQEHPIDIDEDTIAKAVDDWLYAHPEATTTVEDGSITQEKLSDELIKKLNLEPNHHYTEVKLTMHNATFGQFWTGTDAGSSTSTELFETPQYIRIVNRHNGETGFPNIRFANTNDFETAVFKDEQNGEGHQCGYFKQSVLAGEEAVIPTYEYGSVRKKYMQIRFQPSAWQNAWKNIDVYAIYDTWRPTYNTPADAESKEIFLEDLPMKWIVTSGRGADYAGVYCAVPYYPDYIYSIRGGYYANTTVKSMYVYGLYDDISVFDTPQKCIVGQNGAESNVNAYFISKDFGGTVQYDPSVNGGANADYKWAYFHTPKETEHTGCKWLLIQFNTQTDATNNYVRGNEITSEYVEYALGVWLGKGTQYEYISRWQNKDMPRTPTTQLRIVNPNLNDGGTIYQAFNGMNANSPIANSRWVLFGDSLTDSYGGHDKSSQYFAAKIANEFNIDFDNRAKSGSNIYAGGYGNYTAVSGIIQLNNYLAEIEAGTTEQADYITVAFGTNSFADQMGTNADTSATTTSVYGATKYFIEQIRAKVPNAVLGFVLSPRQDWGTNDPKNQRDLNGARAAIKQVCEDYGVPYIDMSMESGITVDMLPDGIHISSEQSQKLYYHAIRRFMMGL